LSGELLRALPKLLLQRDVARALNRSHEAREILLLGFDDPDALFLQLQRFVEKITDALLIGRSRSHLDAELAPRLALLRCDLIELWAEASVRLFQLCHLPIVQADPLLGKPGNTLAKLLLERRSVDLRVTTANRLTESRQHAQREPQCR
jgi:hypothetical protein